MPDTLKRRRRSVKRFRPYPDLRTYLAESGDTQTNLAEQVGTTQPNIARLANGERLPRPELLERLVKYANVEPESFYRCYLRFKRASKRTA